MAFEPAPPLLDVRRFRLGDTELFVLSHPLDEAADRALEALTPAQRAVVTLAAEGLTNAEIARRRGSSPQTVAKQLSGAYRALGISSRAEAAVLLSR